MIIKLTWPHIMDLLQKAKKRIVLIMPSIHKEWVEVIQTNENVNHLKMEVCIDNSEDVIRNGYGSIKSLEALQSLNAIIKECPGLRINFICIDTEAYCLFLESRILAGNPDGYNALVMEEFQTDKILNQFFPKQNLLFATDETEVLSMPFVESKANEIKRSLEKNPPEEPDLKRKINTYRTHFQYADIHFKGGNIKTKTITIPKETLPFKNADLKERMKTSFNLFTKEDTDKWTNLDDVNKKLLEIRTEFLTPCNLRRGRNILKKENKVNFLRIVTELKLLITEKTKSISEDIQKAINKSKAVLRSEMETFFLNNMPEQIINIVDPELRKIELDEMISEILFKTNIPKAYELIEKMTIDTQYAEFTEEDLSDKKFLAWFTEKKLLTKETENDIASFENAYKLRK